MLRVLGIDPGLEKTGYGLVADQEDGLHVCEAGIIQTARRDTLPRRLEVLQRGMEKLMEELKPEVVVVEELFSHYRLPYTAILMGHARGVILAAASLANLPVYCYGATRVKRSVTGNGHASKVQVQQNVRTRLHLPEIPEPPDVADALAVALCHHDSLRGFPSSGPPATRRGSHG